MSTLASTHRLPMTTSARGVSATHLPGQPAGLRVVTMGVDVVVMVLAVFLGLVGRHAIPVFDIAHDLTDVVGSFAAYLLITWIVVLHVHGAYQPRDLGVGATEYRRVITGTLIAAGAVGILCYLFHLPLSRGFFVITFLTGLPMLLVARLGLRRAIHHARRRGRFLQRTLVVGTSAHVAEVCSVLRRESWLGYRVVGAVLPAGADTRDVFGVPVVASCDQVLQAVDDESADLVIFTGGSQVDVRRLAWELEDHRAQLIVVPSLSDVSAGRVHMRPVGGLPLVHVERPQAQRAGTWRKRTFDVVGALALLVLLSPLLAVVAVAVWAHDRGPVLFRQERIGKGGRGFDCFKFRSMVVDAEAMLPTLASDSDGVLFKMTVDPRVTPVGRVIRRWSLDELPQLVNVLRGDMSLIGPRPPLRREVAQYAPEHRRRLRVRPGLSGLWQVSGRSDLSWEDAVRLDLYYVDNWSMVQDLIILAKTVRVVISGAGAY
ncbi:MAG TPA: sugar transferase [Dermatophilaceae bacterium]|nr:sugar transferase [Dermatophilaceae bacterium]